MKMPPGLESAAEGKHTQLPESTANETFPHVSERNDFMTVKQQHAITIEHHSEDSMVATNHKKLLFCFFGIFVSYFIYGILQEKM